jgi:hypothetical protein
VIYDLWDLQSGNQIATRGTREEALALVRSLLAANPPDYAEALSLGYEDERGEGGIVAEGRELAALAARSVPSPRERTA